MIPPPSFDHVVRMTDHIGMFEHADHLEPRRMHGYCTDDMARLLIVVARDHRTEHAICEAGRTALAFLVEAQGASGRIRNRRSVDGGWQDRRGVEDCWGRSIWAFGTAACRSRDETTRGRAMAHFDRGVRQRSRWPRSMAFAALGAAEVLAIDPRHDGARAVLIDAVTAIGRPTGESAWPWPEPRLTYANAALPEALLAAGSILGRPHVVEDGLTLLRWLLARETHDGHLSPTPVGGAGPEDPAQGFDQQPIEVAAMADACVRAAAVTGDDGWHRGADMAIRWFNGANDAGALMWDASTGGGFDGLHAAGPNRNQGAESTLALISTLQHGRLLAVSRV